MTKYQFCLITVTKKTRDKLKDMKSNDEEYEDVILRLISHNSDSQKCEITNKYYKSFFEYFLDHAICCYREECICKASTFRDLICEPELRKKYREIKEILEK